VPMELVMFDLDGTLVDHAAAARTAFTEWLGRPDLAALWDTVA
jgi:beta-phosphoglucomutase-like phosphatase (HAD superfamily)